jgi:hypothetical protein
MRPVGTQALDGGRRYPGTSATSALFALCDDGP